MDSSNWITFNLADALSGMRVGIPNTTDYNDLTLTGVLKPAGVVTNPDTGARDQRYEAKLNIYTVTVDGTGTVRSMSPAITGVTVGTTQLKVVNVTLGNDIGTDVGRTRSGGGSVHISVLEPRDSFAIAALGMIMRTVQYPDQQDDGSILGYCRAAYRWAKGMMQAAADARLAEDTPDPSDDPVPVDPNELQGNTEKILYNISQYIKGAIEDGLPVMGVDGGEPLTVTGEVEVTNSSPIEVSVKNLPTTTINGVEGVKSYVINDATHPAPVTVQNSQPIGVTVENSQPIEITGEVEVTSLPSEEPQQNE